MTPEQLAQFEEMRKRLDSLERGENVSFLKSIERNTIFVTQETLNTLKLSDLADVSGTDSATTGKVLKKTATTWQPGDDNVA